MTISVIQEVGTTGGSGTTCQVTINGVTNGSSLHVFVEGTTSTSVTGVADGTNTYTQRGATVSDASSHIMAQFTADGVTGGNLTLTATVSPSGTNLRIGVREIGGTTGYDSGVNNQQFQSFSPGTDALTSGNMTPSVQPGLISGFIFITITGGDTFAIGTGFSAGPSTTMWGNLTEQLRYTATTARAATFSTTSGAGSVSAFVFGACFKEAITADTPMGVCIYTLP